MTITVQPGPISGMLEVPASKSMQQRACALALLNKGITILSGSGESNDENSALSLIASMGAITEKLHSNWVIHSSGKINIPGHLFFGESGLCLRMFTPIAALSSSKIELNGYGSLLNRNMDGFMNSLRQMGVRVEHKNSFLPFAIQGPLTYHPRLKLDTGDSSQFLSGLLMAISSTTQQTVQIDLLNPVSKPYIDMTMEMMRNFGHRVERSDDFTSITLSHSTELFGNRTVVIEGDWTHGALLLVAGALAGDMELSGLKSDSVQGDRQILNVLDLAGVKWHKEIGKIKVEKANEIHPFTFDAIDCPDLFPAMVLLASKAKGLSRISGVHRLWHKESNRATSLIELFKTFGVHVYVKDDNMYIEGATKIKAAGVQSYQDHRIAMVAAVAGLMASGPVEISGAESVQKSYPQFFTDLRKLGASIEYRN